MTGDDWITPQDALAVINHVNAKAALTAMAGEGEMAPAPLVPAASASAARPPAKSTSAAVDILMATAADEAPKRASRTAATGKSKIESASDEWPDLLVFLTREYGL